MEQRPGLASPCYVENFHHLVWTTHRRLPLLTPLRDRLVYRCIEAEAARLQSTLLGINGTADHVHVVVRLHAHVSCSRFAQQLKDVSAARANRSLAFGSEHFAWNEGYGCVSLSPFDLPRALAYVEHQKEHHALDDLWSPWERVSP